MHDDGYCSLREAAASGPAFRAMGSTCRGPEMLARRQERESGGLASSSGVVVGVGADLAALGGVVVGVGADLAALGGVVVAVGADLAALRRVVVGVRADLPTLRGVVGASVGVFSRRISQVPAKG